MSIVFRIFRSFIHDSRITVSGITSPYLFVEDENVDYAATISTRREEMNRRDSSRGFRIYGPLCPTGVVGIRARGIFLCPPKTALFYRERKRELVPHVARSPCLGRPGVCLISELPFRPLCSTPREHDQSPNGPGRPRSFVCRSGSSQTSFAPNLPLSFSLSLARKASPNRLLFFIGMRL